MMMQTPFTPVVMQQQQQQQKDIQSSLALPTPPTVNQKNLSTPALPSSSSSSSSSTSSPKITLSPNHHNYYTNHLNKAQFNSILINCSINLLKIIYKKNLGDEKSIKMFIIEILRRSKTSIQTLQLACFYLFKIITKTGANEEKQDSYYLDPKKLFLGLIIIASKFNQDYNYSFKSWCKICGLKEESNVKSLQKIEFEILQKLNYELSLINEKYENWCNLLLIFGYDFIKYQIINDDENKNDIVWDDKINNKLNNWSVFFRQLNLNNLNIINVNFNNYFQNQLNKKVFIVNNVSYLESVSDSTATTTTTGKKRSLESVLVEQPIVKKIRV